MRRLVGLFAAVIALVEPSVALEVSVCGDATYELPEDRGVICASADPVPPGTACPLKGDKASTDCFENLPSYDAGACVAPEDAVCALVSGKTWGCVLPSVGCGEKALTTAAPATKQCETWDYNAEEGSAASIDVLFNGNEDYDESWFVEVTKVTVLFACGTDKPTAAPTSEPKPTAASTSEPTPEPTSESTEASDPGPTPAPTDTEDAPTPEPTQESASSDTTDTTTQDGSISESTQPPTDSAGSSSGSTGSSATPAPTTGTSETASSEGDDGPTLETSSSEAIPPSSGSTDDSGSEPTPSPTSDTTDSLTSDTDEPKSTPAPTTNASKSDESTPEVTPAPTTNASKPDEPTPEVTPVATQSDEAAAEAATTKSMNFGAVMLLSEPSDFIVGTLKPATITDAPKAYDKPSR